MREAKRHTSWVNPSAVYESTVTTFVRELLIEDQGRVFRSELAEFAGRIARAGYINGLSQLLLKVVLPGVPDFYQGSEFWDFNLVDPDNRRPVDFAWRRHTLADLERRFKESPAALAAELAAKLADPCTKQFVTWRALATRVRFSDVFQRGAYVPLAVSGRLAAHVFAFARVWNDQWIAVVVPLQIQCLLEQRSGRVSWDDAMVELPRDAPLWRNEFTGATGAFDSSVAQLLQPLPVALLSSQSA
jgi:(1->4)-alpha-D-glucan 1-alpha-D-glucosylmutase